jgi:RNA polymerase-binding transcription factor DksA
MATKKKAVKPAKKSTKPAKPAKLSVPKAAQAKKAVAKKVAKKALVKAKPAPKKIVAKKAEPAKKAPVLAKKPVAPKAIVTVPAKKPLAAAVAPKPLPKKEENHQPIVNKFVQIKKAIKAQEVKKIVKTPVVLPKINATAARKYEPEFTKSVLDQPLHDPGAPSQRYSDGELSEFKELILRKLEAAKKELAYLQGLITRKDEMGGDESENRYMTMEDGSVSMEREQLSQMASRQITFIDHLEKALMRIENKTYGICRVTGKLIDKARLRAVPHATLSIEAKMGMARNPNIQ